ncbi:MAG: alpha/beta hydrolase [Proteobacteria bacterium]|nr:alpha/beta hydrolase [Pseudomonadota bacterium]
MTFETPFTHVFKPATAPGKRPVLLLHGTGGNEHDLLELGAAVAPGRALLSPRGRVLEHGMPRFFRRFAEGVFDEEDVKLRAGELAEFIAAARKAHGLEAPIALGFSNGANIAAALLLLHPEALAGAVLLRAMAPFKALPEVAHKGTKVLLLSGQMDGMIPLPEARRLAEHLGKAGANVEQKEIPSGHGLTQSDFVQTARFFAETE